MLTVSHDDNKSTCFKFIGADSAPKATHLISNSTSLLASAEECMDSCSFYSGPSDNAILAFGESCETSGTLAYTSSGESCGTIAYSSSGESCGSIASCSVSSGSSFSGGCSYSC